MTVETTAIAGRYTLERVLGRGGMATVYYAIDTLLDRPVALKLLADHLADDGVLRSRLLHEARIAARLSHPAIAQVYDAGEEHARPFIVMEYVDGETLRAVLDRRGRLPTNEVVDLAVQVCGGLECAHAAGLVHRDIKPQNLLVTAPNRVKIVDFGIALAAQGTRVTEQGTILGTAGYLAPEQAAGEQVTASADIYSFGVVLYELLSGEKPYRSSSLPELLAQQLCEAIQPLHELAADIPPTLEQTVRRCLSADPRSRPSSAIALARELTGSPPEPPTERLGGTTTTHTRPVTPRLTRYGSGWRRIASFRSGRSTRARIGFAAVVIAFASLALALTLPRDDPPPAAPAIPAVQRSDDPAQQARNLADWLRSHTDSGAEPNP